MMRNHIGDSTKTGVLATGGLIGAIGASSCCVLPLALALAGVGGAWVGGLTALAPYQSIFLGIGALSVGAGFWRVYRPGRPGCDEPRCGTAASWRWTKAALWVGAALLLTATTTAWWARLLV